ncbi:unnamed protein product [Blepharisma stoltei]|uniref:Uncharacterized protein n=1 Tax=Blepharisma stoltei TaxID=1481888 RepID=A0AAU9K2L5_9CILI|nr:unnamed protein product [Blepharisma stoltei]
MTDKELRIAKITKNHHKSISKRKEILETYKKILSDLEHTLHNELALNRQHGTSISLQENSEKTREELRDQIIRHHFEMLKLQIKEKEAQKKEEKLEMSPKRHRKHEEKREKSNEKSKQKNTENERKQEEGKKEEDKKEEEKTLEEAKDNSIENTKAEGDAKNDGLSEQELDLIKQDEHLMDVIKRYEKTFGRIKDLDRDSLRSSKKSSDYSSVISYESRPRSKSSYSNVSTQSQKDALERLEKLRLEEEKIKKEKEDLLQFLETRSNRSQASSRMTTVSSLFQSRPQSSIEIPQRRPITQASILQKPTPKSAQPTPVKDPVRSLVIKDPVSELIKNL